MTTKTHSAGSGQGKTRRYGEGKKRWLGFKGFDLRGEMPLRIMIKGEIPANVPRR